METIKGLTPIKFFEKKEDANRCNNLNNNNIKIKNDDFSLELIECEKNICFEITYNELFFKMHRNKIDNLYIKCICPNNHQSIFTLEEYLEDKNKNWKALINSKCICFGLHSLDKLNEYYCALHNKIICENLKEKHQHWNSLINKNKFDSTCLIHCLKITYFCKNCHLNLCNECKEIHNM